MASIRRETPSWRVRMSCVAAVIEVRNMNSTSWLWAPGENAPVPAGKIPSPIALDGDRDAGQRRPGRSAPSSSASSKGIPSRLGGETRGPDRARPARRRPRSRASRRAETALCGWPRMTTSADAAAPQRRVVAGRDDHADLERPVLDAAPASASTVAGSRSSSSTAPLRMASTSSAPSGAAVRPPRSPCRGATRPP